ncbi:BppU family phage baseplate upper protein [uncultured Ruminococcus sp.]|uniref:BppU family phage baseplate upper protein n=1 Tax=uncultured Ruminococcus sp. TaxID=165186 RepID=UPI0025D3C34C|nr:BppU family phage baseplate upper protein [uncultured Ruminococcus sp.]
MNEFVYKLTLDLNCAKTPPVICSGQFDKGRKFEFTITANGEPYDVTGCSAVLKGVRTDGSHFAVECTVSNGKIIKTLDDTTLSVRGKTVAKLVISDSTKSYSTQMIIIDVDSALDGNITVADDYSILNRLIEQIHALNESGAIIIDDTINNNSNNAVANKAVAIALAQKSDKSATYTKTELDTALAKKPDKATTLSGYGITDGENIGNKVAAKIKITDESTNYPSIRYLNTYYYDFSEVDEALSGKLDNTSGAVKTDNIANKAVTNEKIANGAITALKLANNAVSGSNIGQNQISTNHLQSGAVTVDKLANNVIETGSGDLNIPDGDDGKTQSATFKYQRVGDYVDVSIYIIFNDFTTGIDTRAGYVNLPYVCKDDLTINGACAYNKKLVEWYVTNESNGIDLKLPDNTIFIGGTKLTFNIKYRIA